jgi:hypothetical protein
MKSMCAWLRGWLVAMATTAVLSASAHGWSWPEHRAAARLCCEKLTPKAKIKLMEWLKVARSEDLPQALAMASVFPDQYRVDHKETFPWHYYHVLLESSGPDLSKQDPNDRNTGGVVVMILNFKGLLAHHSLSAADRDMIDATRVTIAPDLRTPQMAVRFLLHLSQDIQQPLHIGDNHDGNGSKTMVKLCGVPMNFHVVWDSGILGRAYDGSDDRFRALNTPRDDEAHQQLVEEYCLWGLHDFDSRGAVFEKEQQARFQDAGCDCIDPRVWAKESWRMAKRAYHPEFLDLRRQLEELSRTPGSTVKEGATLDAEYVRRALPIAQRRLYLAAARSAAMFNEICK